MMLHGASEHDPKNVSGQRTAEEYLRAPSEEDRAGCFVPITKVSLSCEVALGLYFPH